MASQPKFMAAVTPRPDPRPIQTKVKQRDRTLSLNNRIDTALSDEFDGVIQHLNITKRSALEEAIREWIDKHKR